MEVPGISFSSCAGPIFNCVQGISDGGHELTFWKVLEWRKHTRTISSTSMKVRGTEVQSRGVWRYVEAQNAPEENKAYVRGKSQAR